MPARRRPPGPRNRRQLPLCTCKSHCTVFNPQTGRHEGEGQHIDYATLVRHRRDDRLNALLRLSAESPGIPAQPSLEHPSAHDHGDSHWIPLIRTELQVISQLPVTSPSRPLQFCNDPKSFAGSYTTTWPEDRHECSLQPNAGQHALQPWNAANIPYLQTENRLWEIFNILGKFEQTPETVALQDEAYELLQRMDREKEVEWIQQCSPPGQANHFNTSIFFRLVVPHSPALFASCISTLVLHNLSFASRRAVAIQLAGLEDTLGTPTGHRTKLPKDPRTLISRFYLDPITTTYVACPKCHALYRHDPFTQQAGKCTFKKTPLSTVCGEDLWKEERRGPLRSHKAPAKKYVHQDLKSWLGRLLTRPGMEEYLENPWPRPERTSEHENPDASIDDIWGAETFRNLKYRDGSSFCPGPREELRLIFSISVDGFDPFGMKAGKQSAASTGIWMVLLNLPRHLRYLHENMYVAGVIPGPTKPSKDQINHYIQLVVDELKVFWTTGVHYSRTYRHREGRLVKAMAVPLVCDQMAARQVIGYPGTTTAHYTCIACDIDIDDINQLDRSQWPVKHLGEARQFATLHRDCRSEDEQEQIFQGTGWRWSPLWELEYWNPVMFTVIDSMHSIDLNLLKNHCRELMQIDVKKPGGLALRRSNVGDREPRRITNERADLLKLAACQDIIYTNSTHLAYELTDFSRRVLYSFCMDYDIRDENRNVVIGTRWVLAKSIYRWRRGLTASATLEEFIARYPELHPRYQAPPPSPPPSNGDGNNDTSNTSNSQTAPAGGTAEQALLPSITVLRNMARSFVSLPEPESDEYTRLYNRANKHILRHFCEYMNLNIGDVDLAARSAKKTLAQRLFRKLEEDEFARDHLHSYGDDDPSSHPPEASPFLGKDVMEAIWEDMKKTQLPSWVTPVPLDWGTVRRGKLSADNWRVITCIHLPITLIRLFGNAEGRKKQILDNMMDLVKAARIASMRTSSPAQVAEYNETIFRYSRDVLRLYPDYSVLPSHHAALHIGEMIARFGPKHAHDSPHYERYIRFFHRMETNNKMGKHFLTSPLPRTDMFGML